MAESADQLSDLSQLDQLLSEQDKKLAACEEGLRRWRRYSEDYTALRERLSTLPDRLSHQVTVPLGPLAFAPGRLVHTNEVLVLLGDNWFAKTSARAAAAIVDRRLNHCEETLQKLEQERSLFADWRKQAGDLQPDGEDIREIAEPLDEEEEKRWREEHRRRVAEHRREETRLRREAAEQTDVMARLDALENLEQLRDELDRLSGDEDDAPDSGAEAGGSAADSDSDSGSDSDGSVIIRPSPEPPTSPPPPLDSDDSDDPESRPAATAGGSDSDDSSAAARPPAGATRLRKRVSFSGRGTATVHHYDADAPATAASPDAAAAAAAAGASAPASILKARAATAAAAETAPGRAGWLAAGDSVAIQSEPQEEPLPPERPPPERPQLSEVFSYRIQERDPLSDSVPPAAPAAAGPAGPAKRPLSRFRASRAPV